jgi:Xaa-Pro aminopeptidase
MDFARRQQSLRAVLEKQKLDAILITHAPNIRYLCGFTGSAGALLLTARGATFFTDGRYREQSKAEVRNARIVVRPKSPLESASEWLLEKAKTQLRVGIESDHVSVAARDRLTSALGSKARLIPTSMLVERLRMIKDADEIQLMRQAAALGDSLFATILKTARVGVPEIEVAAALEYEAKKNGAQEMSFGTIIASGARSALPHGRASRASIQAGGFVVCDFGVILTGCCSDMTRTLFMGRPSAEARRIYGAVLEAQLAGVAAVRPGATAAEIDHAARKSLKKSGLAKYFTHSTGHGVGLEIHEAPRLAASSQEVLQPGMIITVEPGVYIPGKWGVRIEDTVLVTETGHEILTHTSKELISC